LKDQCSPYLCLSSLISISPISIHSLMVHHRFSTKTCAGSMFPIPLSLQSISIFVISIHSLTVHHRSPPRVVKDQCSLYLFLSSLSLRLLYIHPFSDDPSHVRVMSLF
jgi:hypothetical protein